MLGGFDEMGWETIDGRNTEEAMGQDSSVARYLRTGRTRLFFNQARKAWI